MTPPPPISTLRMRINELYLHVLMQCLGINILL